MFASNRLYIHYQNSLIVNTDVKIETRRYFPHTKASKIVRLDHEASLKLTDNFPKLDGPSNMFPVYSAFIDAVYPENYNEKTKKSKESEEEPDHGYEALAEKKIDIYFGPYPSPKEIEYARECGTELVFTPIGKEALVFFVNAKSDVDNLSTDDIRNIYTNQVKNWSELGFKNKEIIPYQKDIESENYSEEQAQSTFLDFMGEVIPASPIIDKCYYQNGRKFTEIAKYKNYNGAIGFAFRYYLNTFVERDDIKTISLDNVAPTIENISSGKYPITNDIYAVTWKGNPNKNVQKLIDWTLSEDGQYIIEKTGYVPLK